ncbi:small heat shock protein [Pluteus cervinus]|uniref:Small heat shock protein n=1 Tax=Pluteus cervinus TaxID=181527 RepID=A0ACD3B0T1_9AGAR|nr:small heat shock protein [Pluteus cervinus]
MSSVFLYEPFYDFERLLSDRMEFPPLQTARGTGTPRRTVEGTEGMSAVIRGLKPRMDLHEDVEKNKVTATFEMPGMKKEDVKIEVHTGRLTVTGETKFSSEHDEAGYAVKERRFGKFTRTLQLPDGIKDNDIKASMDQGILTVTFPKASAEAAPKRITVG